jgi:RNA polymerase sigma-70 factor, ECF subfamily
MQLRPRPTPRLTRDEFACLVDAHQHRLHVYLAGLVGSAEQAFDLVQETFCDAWSAAQKGSPPFVPAAAADEVARWLFRAGSNNALSLLRRSRRFRWEPLDGLRDTLIESDGNFEQRVAERDALTTALETLSPQDVACLLLRVVHGFSAAETGAILNTSADNVNNRLARAKQRLRAAYLDTPARLREARRP